MLEILGGSSGGSGVLCFACSGLCDPQVNPYLPQLQAVLSAQEGQSTKTQPPSPP